MLERVYYIHALSALHAGTGQGAGVLDLPIAREVATALPIVPGSSIKGALRDCHKAKEENGGDKKKVMNAFGPETGNANDYAGATVFGDARLLCLPVRSFYGVFAWVSSPMVLQRFKRDSNLAIPEIPKIPESKQALVGDQNTACRNGVVYLEDLDLSAETEPDLCGLVDSLASTLAEAVFPGDNEYAELFKQRLVIVNDDVFSYLHQHTVEIAARIRIDDEKKTVKKGALWYEEALPAESILWGLALADKSHFNSFQRGKEDGSPLNEMNTPEQILDYVFDSTVTSHPIQLGGKATVGRGRVRLVSEG